VSLRTAQQIELAPSPASIERNTPYYVKACALGIPAYFVGIHLWTWVLMLPIFIGGRADFRQLYTAGYMVRTGHAKELYDYGTQKEFQDKLVSQEAMALPFVRPAYQALVFAPLSFFPFRTAYFSFLAINLTFLAGSYVLLQPWMHNLRAVYRAFPGALFLGFLPVATALIQGQDSIILLTLIVTAFLSLRKGHEFAAGVLVSLGLFKFQIVIPIAVLFLVWRRFRFVMGFAVCAAILLSCSVWLVGVAQAQLYLHSLLSMSGTLPAAGLLWYPVPVQMMANIHGLVFGLFHSLVPHVWQQALISLLSTSMLVWALFRGSQVKNASDKLLLALSVSVLISYYAFIHDLSVLLLPFIVVLNSSLPKETAHDARGRFISRSATFMFIAMATESFGPDYFYLVSFPISVFCAAISASVLRVDGTCS
jgi:hypothetical protein